MEGWSRAQAIEALVAIVVLSIVARMSGGNLTDWSASFAILFAFLHSQASFDATKNMSNSGASARIKFTFMAKESLWFITCLLIGSAPLLTGSLLFISYPVWGRCIRHLEARVARCLAA